MDIRHFAKANTSNSLYRGLGSISLSAIARAVLQVHRHPSESQQRVLLPVKNSYAAICPAVLIAVETRAHVAALRKLGQCEFTFDTLLASSGGKELEEACRFLVSLLGDGALRANEVRKLAGNSGIAWRTLRRANKVLGTESKRRGFGRGSEVWWQLPNDHAVVSQVKQDQLSELVNQLVHGDDEFFPAPDVEPQANRRRSP